MLSAVFLATLCLAIEIGATPVAQANPPLARLPFTKQYNLTKGHHLLHHTQARAQTLKLRGRSQLPKGVQPRAIVSIPVDNQAVSYVASVVVGSGSNNYQLLIDTGSSNTWLGANKAYVKTSTSTKTTDSVSVSYGSGSFSGSQFVDRVVLGSGLTVQKQSIGVATKSSGFSGVDGILGIGPAGLTVGTLSPDFDTEIPTVTDNLFAENVITNNVLAVSFEPTDGPESVNGELTWGGTDSTKYTGSITYVPLTRTSPADGYWGIDAALRYGSSTTILGATAGIVDTGTTLVLIATDAFQRYKTATGAVEDSNTGLLRVTSAQFSNLKSLFVTAAGTAFELTANAQLWPRNLNTEIGGTASNIYLVVSDLGSDSGEGLDFILGMSFLERFYSVYDTGNKRVGLAKTQFTTATTN